MGEAPQAALYTNVSGRFECRLLSKHENHGKCVFTSLLPRGEIVTILWPTQRQPPVPVGEREEFLMRLEENDQVVFRYVDPNGDYAGYPWCPAGPLATSPASAAPRATCWA